MARAIGLRVRASDDTPARVRRLGAALRELWVIDKDERFELASHRRKGKRVKALSKTQVDVLIAIRDLRGELEISPTVREIAKRLGIRSSSTIHSHLSRLERQGYITRNSLSPRSVRIIREIPKAPHPLDSSKKGPHGQDDHRETA